MKTKSRHFQIFLNAVSPSSLALKKKKKFDYIEKKLRSFTGIGNVLFPKQSGTYKELVFVCF